MKLLTLLLVGLLLPACSTLPTSDRVRPAFELLANGVAQYTDRDENFPDAERVALMAGLKEIHAELKEERFDASGKEAELRYLVNLYTQYVLDDPLLDTYARQLRLRTGFLMLQLLDISREE